LNSKFRQKRFYDRRYESLQRASNKQSSLPSVFYDRRLIEMVFKAAKNRFVDSVLDVGTGQGTDAVLLSKNAHNVVAIDISSHALITANTLSRTKSEGKNISFIVGDAEHLPLREDTFDLVYCKDLLHHVCDSLLAVSEMRRVAKTGGSVAAIEANAYNPQMIAIGLVYFSVDRGVFGNTKENLADLFFKSGLLDVSIAETEFLPRHVLFEYRSPIAKILNVNSVTFLKILEKIERWWQRRVVLLRFSNYLIVTGIKKRRPIRGGQYSVSVPQNKQKQKHGEVER
jgi:ubiquinone/menaquinone biosynthesis C-methylase UbiE